MSVYKKLLSQALTKVLDAQRQKPSVAEQLLRIRPGMSMAVVRTLIGEPDKIERAQAAERREIWKFSATTLTSNVRGTAAAMGLAFQQGLNDRRDQQLMLCFVDGVLSSIEGAHAHAGADEPKDSPSE